MNLCTACGEDFSSVAVFDAHRVGKHEYLFSKRQPNGRRCLTLDEMEGRGWTRNRWERWSNPELVEAVNERFGQVDA